MSPEQNVNPAKNYHTVIETWIKEYAPKSDNIEYGAVLFRRGSEYFFGKAYQGFKTKNWWTVVNGLVLGYLKKPSITDKPVGFVHTHPHQGNAVPSGPDFTMAKYGPALGLTIFAMGQCDKNGSNLSIKYFDKNGVT
ncbi:MAG: hypothetical protein FWG40_02690 [Peptococcaceae bacterium]|nr:hypothetical protein [Peptococcaceae bacterium]